MIEMTMDKKNDKEKCFIKEDKIKKLNGNKIKWGTVVEEDVKGKHKSKNSTINIKENMYNNLNHNNANHNNHNTNKTNTKTIFNDKNNKNTNNTNYNNTINNNNIIDP